MSDKNKGDDPQGIGGNIYEQLRRQMNYLFKDVLNEMDSAKGKVITFTDDKEAAFKAIRKKLLDRGNDVINTLKIFLNEVEVVGVKSIIKIGPKLQKELKTEEEKPVKKKRTSTKKPLMKEKLKDDFNGTSLGQKIEDTKKEKNKK